jgi:hypothetical protein
MVILFSRDSCDFLFISQFIFLIVSSNYLLLAFICVCHVSFLSRWSRKYLTPCLINLKTWLTHRVASPEGFITRRKTWLIAGETRTRLYLDLSRIVIIYLYCTPQQQRMLPLCKHNARTCGFENREAAMGIRSTDYATPFIRETLHLLRRRGVTRYSPLADWSYGGKLMLRVFVA